MIRYMSHVRQCGHCFNITPSSMFVFCKWSVSLVLGMGRLTSPDFVCVDIVIDESGVIRRTLGCICPYLKGTVFPSSSGLSWIWAAVSKGDNSWKFHYNLLLVYLPCCFALILVIGISRNVHRNKKNCQLFVKSQRCNSLGLYNVLSVPLTKETILSGNSRPWWFILRATMWSIVIVG